VADANANQHFICQDNPFVGLRVNRGFTLIEIMIALLVLAILASISIPSIQPIIRKNRLTTETNRLLADLAYSRAEGIMRSGTVMLCSSADGAACIGEDWTSGRLIYADLNGNGTPDPAGGEILRYTEAPHTETTITPGGITYPLVFQQRGFLAGAGVGTGLLVEVTGLPSTEFRDVCINATGQTRVRRLSTDQAC
jgi:type IV fimbrial biogenesis protein FimT